MIPRLLKPGLTMFLSGPSRERGARRYLSPSPCCGVVELQLPYHRNYRVIVRCPTGGLNRK